MFDQWFTELMYISGFPHGVKFSQPTWVTYFKCKKANERMVFYWDN